MLLSVCSSLQQETFSILQRRFVSRAMRRRLFMQDQLVLLREVDVWDVAVVSSQVWWNYGADLSAEDVFLITSLWVVLFEAYGDLVLIFVLFTSS